MKKTSLSGYSPPRRRNPLALLPVALLLLVVLALVWFWSRGGERAQTRVEKPIPAERLGH